MLAKRIVISLNSPCFQLLLFNFVFWETEFAEFNEVPR